MTLDEVLEATRVGEVYRVQLNEEHSIEFLERYPELMRAVKCFYCIINRSYETVWGTKIKLHGDEPIPGRFKDV